MSQPNVPVVNAGLLYVNNLQLSWLSNSTLLVQPGAARDSTDSNDLILPQAVDASGNPVFVNGLPQGVIINSAVVGANGLDKGPLVPNAMYAVYLIASSTSVSTSTNALGGGPSPNPLGPLAAPAPVNPFPVAALLSAVDTASSTAPLNLVPNLPFGYDMYRRIGWVASGNFLAPNNGLLKFYQFGVDEDRVVYLDLPIVVLNGVGNAGAYAPQAVGYGIVGSLTANLPAVPPISTQVIMDVSFVANAANSVAQFLPFYTPAAGVTVQGAVRFAPGAATLAASPAITNLLLPATLDLLTPLTFEETIIQWKTSAAADALTLSVVGYYDYLA